MRFELYKSGSEWRWRLQAANNEIIASGESYKNRQDAINAVHLVMATNKETPFYEV